MIDVLCLFFKHIYSEQEGKIYCNEFLAKEDHDSVVHSSFTLIYIQNDFFKSRKRCEG